MLFGRDVKEIKILMMDKIKMKKIDDYVRKHFAFLKDEN